MNADRVATLIISFVVACTAFAAEPTGAPAEKPAPQSAEAAAESKGPGGLAWRPIGPLRGGRVIAVSGIPGDPYTFYFGAVAGGVFRSTDGGSTWTPLFDREDTAAIGALAVAESNPNVIYAGTGEGCVRGNTTWGSGVYRSNDAGRTWVQIGLADTRQIGRIAVDRHNADVVFVAALGHAFGPNTERGLFRSTDGGKRWERVLYRDENTGAIDVVIDPNRPTVVFAALWRARRQPWHFESGGPGSGLFRSADGGTTWTEIKGNGWPTGMLGRIGIAVSPADSDRVYAQVEAKEGGLYRSDDGGTTWKRVNDDGRLRQRAWYFSHVFADPAAADTVYLENTGLFRSTDGGRTLELLPARHGDHHGLWIDPLNPKRMIDGSDGGAAVTFDGGRTWTIPESQPTAQFYHVAVDDAFPYRVYGAQQDNSTIEIASRTDEGIITDHDWEPVGGGESGYVVPDPFDPDIVYAGAEALLTSYDRRTKQSRVISPYNHNDAGWGAAELAHRFNWTTPIVASRRQKGRLYTAGEVVYRSDDAGNGWTIVSPDLTRNDKSKQKPSGGPLTLDITSVEYYGTIFTLAESPLADGPLWAGSDDGLIHVSKDGTHWTNVTPKALPDWSTVSMLEPSPFDAKTAYAAIDRHRLDDVRPYVFVTHDLGASWSRIDAGLPRGAVVHAVREDPKRRGMLYAATESGVFWSADEGAHWTSLRINMPATPVHNLVVKDDDLVIATHGRSFWILDDIEPLRQLTPAVRSASMHLFRPQRGLRLMYPEWIDKRRPAGENPPNGIVIDYWLGAAPKDELTLDILDGTGAVLRHFSSRPKPRSEQPPEWVDLLPASEKLPAEPGLNRFAWDGRVEPPVEIPGVFWAGLPPTGPRVVPGAYTVRLTLGKQSASAPLAVQKDPRVRATDADFAQQYKLGLDIRGLVERVGKAILGVQSAREQLAALEKRLGEAPPNAGVRQQAGTLARTAADIEQQLWQLNSKSSEGTLAFPAMLLEQVDYLRSLVDSADAAPAQPLHDTFKELEARVSQQVARWDVLRTKEIPALNTAVKGLDLPAIDIR